MVVTFANTGAEHPATLDFVKACDDQWGFNTVWIEALVDPELGKGIRHTIVNYETASRDWEPYLACVKKHGIYNVIDSSCTARMKIEPMQSYLRSVGFKFGKHRNHSTAIGIRLDEIDRMSAKADEYGLIYPLVNWGWTKPLVLAECQKWPVDLTIDEHYGNCVVCFKKTTRKLLTIAQDDPSWFDHAKEMEARDEAIPHRPAYGPMKIFRGHRSTEDIIAMSKEPFRRFVPDNGQIQLFDATSYDDLLDAAGSCNESCEVYADKDMEHSINA